MKNFENMTSENVTLADIDLTDASVWEKAAPHDWLDRLRSEDPVQRSGPRSRPNS